MRISRALILLAALIVALPALAQQAILQGGPWQPGHIPQYVGRGSTQPVVQDGGGSNGGGLGANPGELGITSRAGHNVNTPPYADNGNGPDFEHFCMYDAPTINPTGYHYFCFDPNAQGGGLIDYGAAGGATQQPLSIAINGQIYQFPFTTNSIIGPTTSTVGDFAIWNNTSGTLLQDKTAGAGVVTALGIPINTAGGVMTSGSYLSSIGININGTSTFSSIYYDNASSFSPYELVIQNSVSGNNTLQIRNTNPSSFSAIAFRGPGTLDSPPNQINERMAIGYDPGGGNPVAGQDFIEISNYDGTFNPGTPPSRFEMKQSGGIDPTGGVTMTCALVAGNKTITCPFTVPAYASNLYVWGFNIPFNTQIQSGGGTTTPTLTIAPLATASETVHFWYPNYAQRDFFQATADDQMFFQNWDGSISINMNRIEKNVGIYGGFILGTRKISGTATSDTAASTDDIILWASTATAGKAQSIPGCTPATAGQNMTIVDEASTAATYNINVTPTSGQIRYASSVAITTNSGSLRIVCDGTSNWVPY